MHDVTVALSFRAELSYLIVHSVGRYAHFDSS